MDSIKIRTLVLLSAMAAILSILAGGISGVPFLRIVLRSLISAGSFAVLAFGAAMLLQRFLPELFQDNRTNEDQEDMVGGGIDIMMDDSSSEDGAMPFNPGMTDNASQEDSTEEFQQEQKTPMSPTWQKKEEDFNNPQDLPDIESFAGEFDNGSDAAPREEHEESISQSEPLDAESPSSSHIHLRPSADEEAQDYFKSNSSPEEMAKAIRTVVKRDED
ncbi:MAG: hypothetical protein PF447_03730 [Spirochaetaceae bacterium]|jgi:hypothetical protein|nr:hypothetical protein [Spirochaetaceae bacterium]